MLSSLLKPDPSVEDLGFRDLNDKVPKDEARCDSEQVSCQLQDKNTCMHICKGSVLVAERRRTLTWGQECQILIL